MMLVNSIGRSTLRLKQIYSHSLIRKNVVSGLTNNSFRFYSTSSTISKDHQHHHHQHNQKKSENHQHEDQYYDREEFKKPPKFFKTVVLLVTGGVLYHLGKCIVYFNSDQILDDLRTILTTDDPILKNNLLKEIHKRSLYTFTVEKLYKLGVIEVLVKCLEDPDVIIQARTIKILSSFVNSRYETFSEEAVKKGVGSKLGQIILSNGMNCEAAINLWCELFFSETNQMQLLTSDELIGTLKQFAYSEYTHLQELAISTIKLLYTNREAYPLLPKIRGILNHLKRSQNVLVSNNSEYYLGVLKGEFIPPVGNVTIHLLDVPLMYRLHNCLNLLMVPLAYMYCSYRWKKHTNDPIYWKAKGAYGAGAILLAGILGSISLYPDYYSYKIDKRLKKDFQTSHKTLEEITQSKPSSTSSLLKFNNSSQNNNNNNSLDKNKNIPNDEKKSSWLFSPLSLFMIHQLFPILGNAILLNGWRNSRYIALPSLVVAIPLCTVQYPTTITSNWSKDIFYSQ